MGAAMWCRYKQSPTVVSGPLRGCLRVRWGGGVGRCGVRLFSCFLAAESSGVVFLPVSLDDFSPIGGLVGADDDWSAGQGSQNSRVLAHAR
jgi:hypothetical protein